MNPDNDHYLAQYLDRLQHLARPAEEIARLAGSCRAVAQALDQFAEQSLFDTEPAQLTTVLDKLSDREQPA